MKTGAKVAIALIIGALGGILIFFAAKGSVLQLLEPHGVIAYNERQLMINAVLLMCIVMVPVVILTFFFSWWYRESNTKAHYTPNWEHGVLSELVWWAIPFEIILILGALTWTSSHELDPSRPLAVKAPPVHIEVVALNWKWLFIYPEENIATVNYVEFPVDRPVAFDITSDAPMNSFWIPQLGGQIYAMTGMNTRLNLLAQKVGEYRGVSANYSGEGFEKMKFIAHAVSQEEYDSWVRSVKTSPSTLTAERYIDLAKDSTVDEPLYFSPVQSRLFQLIIERYMPPEERHIDEIMHIN